LAEKDALASSDEDLAAEIEDAPSGSLIAIEQNPLPEGEPTEVLATISWPDAVVGCVLLTEFILLPPGAEREAPDDAAVVEEWAKGRGDGRQARLGVGVLRDGNYVCCLKERGVDDLLISDDLADDLVTALLATF
jgi:hypothetical protein